MLAVEHDGAVPDIVTLGKGLGGGFPVAAFLTTEAVAETVQIGDHGTTFGGSPLACAAANAVLRVLADEGLLQRSSELGAKLLARLSEFAAQHTNLVDDVRGRGLLIGLSLHDANEAASIPARSLARGVLVNVTADRVIRFFPALNIPEDELWPAVETVLSLLVE
jgi:acetylornithine/N-succinyldiaminopimelate aminotransferase